MLVLVIQDRLPVLRTYRVCPRVELILKIIIILLIIFLGFIKAKCYPENPFSYIYCILFIIQYSILKFKDIVTIDVRHFLY